MGHELLRECVRAILDESDNVPGHAILVGTRGDIEQCLFWLKLNDMLRNADAPVMGSDGRWRAAIRHEGSHSDLVSMVKGRFGSFIMLEGPRGNTAAAGPPYQSGRFSLGWGTGGGDFRVARLPHTMGGKAGSKFGGQMYAPDPMKPYSDEFSSQMTDNRKSQFDSEAQRFMGSIDQLKKSLKLARTFDQIDSLLVDFLGGNDEAYEQIIGDEGTLRSLVNHGEMQKAMHKLLAGLDAWAKKRMGVAAGNDFDAGTLENFGAEETTFDPLVPRIMKWS